MTIESDQDSKSSKTILDFLSRAQLDNYQIIIACVNVEIYIDNGSFKVVYLENYKDSLLSDREFKEYEVEIDNSFSYFKFIYK